MISAAKAQRRNAISESKVDLAFLIFVYLFLGLILVVILFPLVNVVAASFSSPDAVKAGKVWLWPVSFTTEGYNTVFRSEQLVTGFVNSLLYMVVGTSINLFMTLICAFPLSRKDCYGRGAIMTFFLFTMYFSGGLVPTYMLINSLRLVDTFFVMVIPGAMSVWFVIVVRSFIQANIPEELFEAARIDGCSHINYFARIVLPLSGAVIAVIGLYYAMGHWNSYFGGLVYLKTQKKFPLQLVLRNILIMNEMDYSMIIDINEFRKKQGLADLLKYAVIVVSSVPMILLYPFVQRYFVRGVMIGALKG